MVREAVRRLLVVACCLAPVALTAPAAGEGSGEAPAEEVWRFDDPEIVESSGLVVTGEHVVTVNDSGDSGRVFVVDRDTGRTVGRATWDEGPVDVEALAPAGEDHVWVADIGDNRRVRDRVEVLRVPVGEGERHVVPERYELAHPDGPADAEALLAHPRSGRLLLVTKDVFGGRVLAAPRRLSGERVNRLREVGTTLGVATGGSFLPDGRHLVIRNYGRAMLHRWPGLESLGAMVLPDQEQGEAIAVAPGGEVFLSTEGLRTPLLRVSWTPDLQDAMAQQPDPPEPPPAPTAEALEPEVWPWLLGSALGVLVLVVLLRSLRPR